MRKALLFFLVAGVLLVGGYFALEFMANKEAERKVAEFFAGMEDVARAEYSEVDVDLLGMDATITDLEIVITDGERFTVDEFVLSRYQETDGLPVDMAAEFKGLHVPVTEDLWDEAARPLREMGYEELVIDYAMDYEYDEGDKTFDLNDMRLTVRDAAELVLSVNMTNVPLESLNEGSPEALLMAIAGAELHFRDLSLLDKLLDLGAKESGESVESMLAQMDVAIDGEIVTAMEKQDEFSAEVLRELKAFLHTRKGLSITCAPAEPVGIMYLGGVEDAQEIIRLLNLDIKNVQ